MKMSRGAMGGFRRFTRLLASDGGRMNTGSKGERARQRIREIDAKRAGLALPLHEGGSLSSDHGTARLTYA